MFENISQSFSEFSQQLQSFLSELSGYLWGWPLIILLLGTHLYLTCILRFPQRYILKAIKLYFVKDHTKEGDISPFSSLMIALAANIGAGNIIGVGVALALGGPGAIFWCWLTGVLGMATRYSEGLLSIKYRVKNHQGLISGGPMYVLEHGMKCKWLAVLFAIFTAIAAFGIGNLTQANAAAVQLQHSFDISSTYTAITLTILTALVILGGIKSIAKVCAVFVPFMAACYIVGCMWILYVQSDFIIPAIQCILECAFSSEAATGGIIGATILTAIRTGVARGLFSNEAGLGSAAIASAAAQNRNPVRQALISSSGPFWDTVVICALTGIVLTTSILAYPDISCSDGAKLTSLAFSKIPVVGAPILTLSLVTFTVSTILGWSYFGEKALEYLGGIKFIIPYRVLWIITVYIGCVSQLDLVWLFADCTNALMAIPNLISLLALSGVLIQQTRYYLWQNRLDEYEYEEEIEETQKN